MSERKTPILLRRTTLSNEVMALYRYRVKRMLDGLEVVECGHGGRQSVQADYDALVLTELVDGGADDIVGILDGVADGEALTDDERAQIRTFRERLRVLIERHNARVDGAS